MNINFNIFTLLIIIVILFSILFISKKKINIWIISATILAIGFFILFCNNYTEKFYTPENKNKYFKLINACTNLGINTTEDHQINDCIYMLNNCKNNGFNHISKTIGGIECGPCFADDKQLCSNTICLNDSVQDGVCNVAINVNDYPLSTLDKTNYD
jgi:hypothetical protein